MPRSRTGRAERAAVPASPRLSLNDLRFVNEYEVRLFQSPGHIDAYQAIHPGCKRASARVSAERVLQKATVQAEIRSRLEASKAVSAETLGACLLRYRQWAEEKQDYVAGASICMDQAKLAGLLIEKRQVESVSVEHSSAIRDLVQRSLTPPPSLTPSLNSEDGHVTDTPQEYAPASSVPSLSTPSASASLTPTGKDASVPTSDAPSSTGGR